MNDRGQMCFAEDFVSSMFRRRGVVSLMVVAAPGSMGDVGNIRLGEATRSHSNSVESSRSAA